MKHKKTIATCRHLTLLGLLSALTACGSNSEKEKACDQASAGFFPVINGIICVFGAIDDATLKPSGSGITGFVDDGPTLGYQIGEYEPNGLLDNANPLVINNSAVSIAGNLGAENDAADNFVFTPTQTGNYQVYLCSNSCDQPLESDTLNLMVLDQSQTTIAATALGGISEKTLSVHLSAGTAYYTEVRTMGTSEPYRLAIIASPD